MSEPITAYMVYIHLSRDEYSGSTRLPDGTWITRNPDGTPIDNMRAAAKEVFDAHPDKPHMIAYVIEHGGWSLSFNKSMVVMGTANDAASLPKEAYEYGELLKGAKWESLPEVWRGREAGRAVA